MSTWVIYSNPGRALTTRYAVVRDGSVVDRKSTRQAALVRAVFFCRQNLETRLAMDPMKWPQIIERAQQDREDAEMMEKELLLIKEKIRSN